ELAGTTRSMTDALRDALPGRIDRVVRGICEALGCGYEVEHERRYPPTVNDARMTELVRAAAVGAVGEVNVRPSLRGMWSEDFAYFGREVPACFFFVGARNEARGLTSPHHSPTFDFDEEALAIGLEVFRR